MSMNVSRHTDDGATDPPIRRLKGVQASATTAGTVEIKNGSGGATVATLLVPLNTSDSLMGLDISCPDGAYVVTTTFVGTVYVYGG